MSLSRVQSLRVAAVLEDCSQRLDIFGHTLMVRMVQEKANMINIIRDCQRISQKISDLQLHLEEEQSFSSLREEVEEEVQRRQTEEKKRKEKKDLEQRKQALLHQQEEIQQKMKKLDELESVRIHLMQQPKPEEIKNEITAEDSHQRRLQHAERQLQHQVELLHKKIKEEMRVHEESEKFLHNQYEELLQQLEESQQVTTQKLQEKKKQLNDVCCKKTLNLDRLMEMKRRFREMEQVIIEEKEEQEKMLRLQIEAKAATTLQAWWRGYMVRKGMSSFKRAKDGMTGKKKKEGKKKK